jgi:hypothetical protein
MNTNKGVTQAINDIRPTLKKNTLGLPRFNCSIKDIFSPTSTQLNRELGL